MVTSLLFTFRAPDRGPATVSRLFSGGYFGVGWVRDLWRIPEYVRDANDDPDYLKRLREKMKARAKPPFSVRLAAASKSALEFTRVLCILAAGEVRCPDGRRKCVRHLGDAGCARTGRNRRRPVPLGPADCALGHVRRHLVSGDGRKRNGIHQVPSYSHLCGRRVLHLWSFHLRSCHISG